MESYLASFHKALAELDTLGFDTEAVFAWTHAEDPLYRRNRKQLIASMPVLAVILAAEPSIPILMELAVVIDRGDPLIDSLAELIQVRKQSIRYLIGKSILTLGSAWLTSPLELFVAINLLPQEKLPQSEQDWTFMRTPWEGSGFPRREFGAEPVEQLSTLGGNRLMTNWRCATSTPTRLRSLHWNIHDIRWLARQTDRTFVRQAGGAFHFFRVEHLTISTVPPARKEQSAPSEEFSPTLPLPQASACLMAASPMHPSSFPPRPSATP